MRGSECHFVLFSEYLLCALSGCQLLHRVPHRPTEDVTVYIRLGIAVVLIPVSCSVPMIVFFVFGS